MRAVSSEHAEALKGSEFLTKPNTASLDEFASLLRRYAEQAEAQDVSDTGKLLAGFRIDLARFYSGDRSQGPREPKRTGFYDRVLKDLLTAVREAISREEFINILLDRLDERSSERASSFVVLIEGYLTTETGKLSSSKLERIVGGNPNHQVNAISGFRMRQLGPLATALLEKQKKYDFLLTHLATKSEYDGDLLELHGKTPMWLCGIPMPSTKTGEPERALVVFFPATIDGSAIYYPRQAMQEWFLLELVPDVFAMLEHQLMTIDDQIEAERRELIMELAPTAINHEIGTAISLIQDSVGRSQPFLSEISARWPDELFVDPLIDEVVTIKRQADRCRTVAQAFTNIDRASKSTASLAEILEEVRIIFENYLAKTRIDFHASGSLDFVIEAEVSMIEHLIMNVIKNAIDAISLQNEVDFVDSVNLPPVRNVWVDVTVSQNMLLINIANDGPEIPDDMKTRMFLKGETSKPHGVGHGQGLYICRLVAAHLGGKFRLTNDSTMREEASVSFSLEIPLEKVQPE